MAAGFEIDARILGDSVAVATWGLSDVRLMDDRRFPWLLLLPRRPGLVEWTELPDADLSALALEIRRAGQALGAVLPFEKLNVAAIGNIVRQMHVHVVGRRVGDAAWPGPVWGSGRREPYEPAQLAAAVAGLRHAFESG